ncbi:hypothetical protein ACJJTC_012390 [Scirpophaga incertulas]
MNTVSLTKRRRIKLLTKVLLKLLREELIKMIEEEIHKKKRTWVRGWIDDRDTTGGSIFLLNQLKTQDPEEYRLTLRMTPENFEELLALVEWHGGASHWHKRINTDPVTLARDAGNAGSEHCTKSRQSFLLHVSAGLAPKNVYMDPAGMPAALAPATGSM